MNKYLVNYSITSLGVIEVEAENEEEAKLVAIADLYMVPEEKIEIIEVKLI